MFPFLIGISRAVPRRATLAKVTPEDAPRRDIATAHPLPLHPN